MNEYGKIIEPGTVQLERLLPGPIERIWAYLTESDKRGKWLGTGQMDLKVGGKVNLFFRHSDLSPQKEDTPEQYQAYANGVGHSGHILRCEPPRFLSYTWDEESGTGSEVSFELSERGHDVLLVITHSRLPNRGMTLGVSSGWHTHVGILIDHLQGKTPAPFWSSLASVKDEYEKRL